MAGFDGVDDIMIDLDSVFDEDPSILFQSSEGDFTHGNFASEFDCDASNNGEFNFQTGKSEDLGGEFDNALQEPSLDTNVWFGGSEEGYSSFESGQGAERAMDPELPGCGSSFAEMDSNCVLGHMNNMRAGTDGEGASYGGWMDAVGRNFNIYGSLAGNGLGFTGHKSYVNDVPADDMSSYDVISSEANTVPHSSDYASDLATHCSGMPFCNNTDDVFLTSSQQSFFHPDFSFGFVDSDGVLMKNERDETNEYKTQSASSASRMPVMSLNFKTEQSDLTANGEISYSDEKAFVMPFNCTGSSFSENQTVGNGSVMQHFVEAINGRIDRKSSGVNNNLFVGEDLKQSSSKMLPSMSGFKHEIDAKDEKGDIIISTKKVQVDGKAGRFMLEDAHIDFNGYSQYPQHTQLSSMSNKQNHCENGRENNLIQSKSLGNCLSRVSPESIQGSSSGNRSPIDDDTDICILEDISQPVRTSQYQIPSKAIVPMQCTTYSDSFHYAGVGATRYRANDERVIFQAALQDLSQPKSEANLPTGVLAVPLLRHQRIALWWMIQKETSSVHCSGGILADDQGLGKTVSTIALILKEKPPSLCLKANVGKKEVETLDLDKDDDEVTEIKALKKEGSDGGQMSSNNSSRSVNSFARGRPAGGTLVVCPTSVLRQWADELKNKVTNESNLSVLVYHGSARTRDPYELTKYDVVLTTYAIVSMEVPKQPLVDQDDDEKRKLESDGVAPVGLLSGKKRKDLNSGKKGTKSKKTMDASEFEAVARPLAKVGWFRVVLDEAQSIKNHRTQVARACWGLRAKRRWCLSGTPIQNAIDDLYSYFRFLRYDPYATYKLFCSTIKVPVQKNPARGYKKLQAVLKTIMLRRTKGTCIDGEPIITLPPKVIQLKKIEFTEEERDFYSKLEADSRAQFQEYAAAGTVKQNYVNILLMLLRLRQACDHPLLVRGVDSNSLEKFSVEMAKQLPLEKQQFLLKSLQASLAICGICSDPPEDAVVSICGHVFCNQCISEHLSGDDSKCPIRDCKNRLSRPSIFSKATMDSCLSDHVVQDVPSSEHASPFTSYSEGCPYGSSKIRAALEVLQSLTKHEDATSAHNHLENSFSANAASSESSSGNGGIANSDERKPIDKNTNNSVKVVGEKAIVFSQWTRMLDILEACLKKSSIQYRRLDGMMSVLARDKAVKDFNTLPEVSVMIMSLKAASLGLNMVAASRVLLLDLWWNPTTEDQAIDRAHRIGQTRPVTVSRLTVKDTVEDRILALQQKKREMVASAFGEDETGARQTRLTVEDLEYLFMV